MFGNGVELNVRCSFVNAADFTVSVILFHDVVLGESDAAHPLDTFGGGFSGRFRAVIFRHGGFLDEWHFSLLQSTCVVDQKTGAFDLCGHSRDLMLHGLHTKLALLLVYIYLRHNFNTIMH